MTGDVVNLRQFRKRQARAEREKQAEQNRISFGRTKTEKCLTTTLNEKASKTLDQGRLEGARPGAPGRSTPDGEET